MVHRSRIPSKSLTFIVALRILLPFSLLPRVGLVPLVRYLDAHAGAATRRRVLAVLGAFEALSRWPTPFFTGHLIAARLVKS